MREVMQKTQELAVTILRSDIYRHWKSLEEKTARDPAAAEAAAAVFEKKNCLERVLAGQPDPEAIRTAAEALEEAQKALDAVPDVEELRKAREAFDRMMDNVERILRLAVTGETKPGEGACSGDCVSCGGCG